MISAPNRFLGLAVAILAAAGLAACSSSSTSSPSASSSSGQPKSGGTLHIVAAAGPDHIDTVPAYYTADYMLERGYARQLLAYPTAPYTSFTSQGWTTSTTPAADMATDVPSTTNGGISTDGKTYTFHIKQGVDWNSSPPRQVTSSDFVREFKAFCNPVSPVGNEPYYLSTIQGMSTYCDAETAYFAVKSNAPTAANIANFQNTHNISGIAAPDPSTIQFTLIQPASDFLYMLAMPFASARPVEYDQYVPNSLQLNEHSLSDGPYEISSYIPNKSITMVHNSAWKQSTDSIRHDYVSTILVTEGVSSAQTQLSDMQAGTQDLPIDTTINPTSIPSLAASHASNFVIWPWSTTFPYLTFNLRSPDDNKAMSKLLVRQAIEYGVDKAAAVKAAGGADIAKVINTVIPPGNVGYQDTNAYPDNNGNGDTATCKSDLARAGYPNGLSLGYVYPSDSTNTRIFEAIQASLALCGVQLKGKPEPGTEWIIYLGNSPENTRANQWDMGQAAWIPDWFGNNGRTVIQALFQGPDCVINTTNYGCYDSQSVNSLITQAEGASSPSAAGSFWQQADAQIMKDAAMVPLMDQYFPLYASSRVRGVGGYPTAVFAPNIGDADITNVWLASGS